MIVRASLKKGVTVNSIAKPIWPESNPDLQMAYADAPSIAAREDGEFVPVRVAEGGVSSEIEAKQTRSISIEAQATRVSITASIQASVLHYLGVRSAMIAPPNNAHNWIVAGVTDLRRGFTGSSAAVETVLSKDPFAVHVFIHAAGRHRLETTNRHLEGA